MDSELVFSALSSRHPYHALKGLAIGLMVGRAETCGGVLRYLRGERDTRRSMSPAARNALERVIEDITSFCVEE